MNYEKEIRKLLDIAKTHGLNQRKVSERLGKRSQYITEGLSKGGNEDMYTRIKLLIDNLEIEKSNVVSEPQAEYSVPVPEYISQLKRTNKVLEDLIGSNLATLQAAQQTLLSTMTENHKVILHVLAADQKQLIGKMDDLEKKVSSRGKSS